MRRIIYKTVLATLSTLGLLSACSKKDAVSSVPDVVDHSKDSVELLAPGKGFKKVYGYVASTSLAFPGTLNEIHGIDLTVEGTDKVNFAFYQSNGSQQGVVKSVLKATANFATKSIVTMPKIGRAHV